MSAATRSVHVPQLGMELDLLADDTIIGPSIERGAWEEHETALFRAHLEPGCQVLDLGANIGWFSAQAIRAGCEVHAFEPVPFIADVAEANIERANALGPGRGVLHRFAAGSEPGTATIALAGSNRGDNRVLDGGTLPDDMSGAESLEIRIERVDDHVRGATRVIKIDTQGSEWLALRGMRRLLSASQRCALLLEFWPYALRGCEPPQLLDLLRAEGFTVGKATAAPYPMTPERILRQASRRDPVRGGLDLYATRGGAPFHVLGAKARLRGLLRSWREE